jgi:type II secretory pathway pseudopilin PulG
MELVVVLTLLGVMTALVVPPLTTPVRPATTLAEVVRGARSAALARAQVLQLTVTPGGRWALYTLAPTDGDTLASGTLAPESATSGGEAAGTPAGDPSLQLQITALGACLPVPPLSSALRDWDAAACRPVRAGARSATTAGTAAEPRR